MKAIRIHEFGAPVLRLEEVPEPQPGPGQVLVKVHAVGVNPYEGYMRAGAYAAPPLPFTPATTPPGWWRRWAPASKRCPGDRVYTSGTLTGVYAERPCAWNPGYTSCRSASAFAQGAG